MVSIKLGLKSFPIVSLFHCRCPLLTSLSICPFVHLRPLVRNIISLPLSQSGSYITHIVPMGKGCAVTLIQVFRSTVKVIAELCENSLSRSYILSPQTNPIHSSSIECLWSGVCSDLERTF